MSLIGRFFMFLGESLKKTGRCPNMDHRARVRTQTMTTSAIHQFVAGFGRGDAISNEALVFRRILRSWGCPSEIFTEQKRILPELRGDVRDIKTLNLGSDDAVILHLSTGSDMNDRFASLPCHKIVRYHNITPPEYFRGIAEQTGYVCARGREQAKLLANQADLALSDSAFNAADLTTWGYRDIHTLPLILDLTELRAELSERGTRNPRDDLTTILFVGRCAPNKRIEDCLAAFYYFQKYVEPNSRFVHVGSFSGMEAYHAMLLTLAQEMDIRRVEMPGAVPQRELNAYYQGSRVFLCMSEHEGFGVPLIESMVHDLPILAHEAAAVPETLDAAGILFREKRFDLVAEMMGRLTHDPLFRNAVIEGQRERLKRYEKRDLAAELRQRLAPLLSP
jgi:L-malate glycosyltransferase